MGVRLITGEDGETVLYCSTTMWAFGPVFGDADTAEAFLDWMLPTDVRSLSDNVLTERYLTFLTTADERKAAAEAEEARLAAEEEAQDLLTEAYRAKEKDRDQAQ